jgi:hypothetical protein
MINEVSGFIFFKYEAKIIGAAFCTVINKQFGHLSPSLLSGIINVVELRLFLIRVF